MRIRLALLGLVVAVAAVACTDPLKPNPIEHPGLPSVTLDSSTSTSTAPTTTAYVIPTEPTSSTTWPG